MKNTTEKKECYYCKVGWTPIGGYHTITNCPPIGTASSVSIKCPMPMKKQNKKECDCCKCYCERCKDCRREPCTVHISSPNQVSWEDITWDTDGESWWLIYKGEHYSTDGVVKLIRSLLKEERERVIRELAHETADGYCCACGYDIAYFETEINKLKSKLSKGKV